jgi:hypothetical protein
MKPWSYTAFCLQTAKQEFVTVGSFRNLVFKGLLDPELACYSDKAWFTLSSYIKNKNNRYWSTENTHAVHEVA